MSFSNVLFVIDGDLLYFGTEKNTLCDNNVGCGKKTVKFLIEADSFCSSPKP